MALRARGIRITQKQFAKVAGTNKETGTSTQGLIRALKKFGAKVEYGNGYNLRDIRHALDQEKIVIVCYTEHRGNEGHYAVLAGFQRNTITLYSPDEKGGQPVEMSVKEFGKRWKDPLFTKTIRWAAFIR